MWPLFLQLCNIIICIYRCSSCISISVYPYISNCIIICHQILISGVPMGHHRPWPVSAWNAVRSQCNPAWSATMPCCRHWVEVRRGESKMFNSTHRSGVWEFSRIFTCFNLFWFPGACFLSNKNAVSVMLMCLEICHDLFLAMMSLCLVQLNHFFSATSVEIWRFLLFVGANVFR